MPVIGWPSPRLHNTYQWLLVAHTKHADVRNPSHTCNCFLLSPLTYVEWSYVGFTSCFVATISNVRILFYLNCLTLKCKLAFSRDTQVLCFSRVRDVDLKGVLLGIRHKSIVFGVCLLHNLLYKSYWKTSQGLLLVYPTIRYLCLQNLENNIHTICNEFEH